MKKKIFVFLALTSLTLTGCSFSPEGLWNSFLELVGIRKKADDKPAEDEHHEDHEEEHHEEGPKSYSTSSTEHWYIDDDGVEHRATHEFTLVNHSEKTCKDPEKDEYKCSICDYVKIVNGHELKEHKYSSVTVLPTCSANGSVTFTCSECGEEHVTVLPKDGNAHAFAKVSEDAGVTTYKCSLCQETKTVIDYASQTTAQNVSTEALQNVDEIQLENASISFDDSVLENDLGESINITAEAKEPTEVAQEIDLAKEDQEKLAGKPIVDFSVTNSGSDEKISEFSGKVKVTIPYELQPGENADGIAIWYLSQDNEPEAIKAAYSNGNVSFETDHFSYYAVVHLTPEESCAKFGHEMVKGTHADSTCVAHGYDEEICRRCNKIVRETLPLVPHSYECVSKIDATTLTEGNIHYECKVCNETYDVVIPKLVPTDRGFYVNLVYSALTPEWRNFSSETQNGETRTYDSYQGLDYDGKYFSYSSYGSCYYQGYSYNEYNRHEQSPSSSLANTNYKLIRDYIDYIPQIYKDKVEDVCDWLVSKYFVKEEIVEGYKFSVDYSKVVGTYEDFRDKTIQQAIVNTIGQDNFDEIYNFLVAHYEDTVDDLITELNSRGYVVSVLFDAIQQVMLINGQIEKAISFDDVVTAEIRSQRVIDLIEGLISGMGGSGSGESKPQDMDPEHSGEEEVPVKPERSKGMLPETAEDFKEKLDEVLSGNLFDYVEFIAPIEKDVIIEIANGVADELKSGKMSYYIKTTKDGSFISMEAIINNIEIPGLGSSGYTYALMTKDYDKAAVLDEVNKEVAKYNLNKAKFTLNSSNYAWFAQPIEEHYSQTYPGFKLEYKRNYNNEGYDALVSNVNIKTSYEVYDAETGSYVFKYGKLVILIEQPSNYHYEYNESGEWVKVNEEPYYGTVVKNENKLGTLLPEGEVGLKQYFNSYERESYIVSTEGTLTQRYKTDVPSFEYLYKVSDGTMHATKANGTYNYMYEGFYKPTLSSFEEWDAYEADRYPDSDWVPSEHYDGNYLVIKAVDQLDGEVYFKAEQLYEGKNSHVATTYVLDPAMNEEALESIYSFEITYGYKDKKLVGYLDGEYQFNPFNDSSYTEEEVNENYSLTKTYGNVTVSLNAPKGTYPCTRKVTWKIGCGSKTIISGSNNVHMFCYAYENYEYKDIPGADECHYTAYRKELCKLCGKIIYEYSEERENHDWDYENANRTWLVERTYTTSGILKTELECKRCHDHRDEYDWEMPCAHYNGQFDEHNHFSCPDCGYEVDTEDGTLPAIIYEPYPSAKEDYMSFSMWSPRYRTWYLDSYYRFSLCAGYFDDDGVFQTLANVNDSMIFFNWEEFPEEYSHEYDIWGTFAFTLNFSRSSYEELVKQAQESEEAAGKEIIPTIAAADRDSGTVFYYAIY